MSEGKTIGQLMEEMRVKAGAQNYHGHGYMDLQRFAEDTRHMIIFDVHDRGIRFFGSTAWQRPVRSTCRGDVQNRAPPPIEAAVSSPLCPFEARCV